MNSQTTPKHTTLFTKKTARDPNSTIWRFQNVISVRLLVWASLNVFFGVWLQQRQNKFWRGVAMQAIGWGAINAAIAIIGNLVTRIRKSNMADPYSSNIVEKEKRNLLRILWFNTGLDVFYILGGLALAATRGARDRLMRGNGWGIVIQGGFLFFFDAIHAIVMSGWQDDSDTEE